MQDLRKSVESILATPVCETQWPSILIPTDENSRNAIAIPTGYSKERSLAKMIANAPYLVEGIFRMPIFRWATKIEKEEEGSWFPAKSKRIVMVDAVVACNSIEFHHRMNETAWAIDCLQKAILFLLDDTREERAEECRLLSCTAHKLLRNAQDHKPVLSNGVKEWPWIITEAGMTSLQWLTRAVFYWSQVIVYTCQHGGKPDPSKEGYDHYVILWYTVYHNLRQAEKVCPVDPVRALLGSIEEHLLLTEIYPLYLKLISKNSISQSILSSGPSHLTFTCAKNICNRYPGKDFQLTERERYLLNKGINHYNITEDKVNDPSLNPLTPLATIFAKISIPEPEWDRHQLPEWTKEMDTSQLHFLKKKEKQRDAASKPGNTHMK